MMWSCIWVKLSQADPVVGSMDYGLTVTHEAGCGGIVYVCWCAPFIIMYFTWQLSVTVLGVIQFPCTSVCFCEVRAS